ncbi:MAG: 2-dehydropantoate 2-reductase [Burkholderiales bacterium]|jgi:2-dehydropantoate 2-reductase|nr:2-dehydropantoate 2-reductase [Burkholderiales bacterium]
MRVAIVGAGAIGGVLGGRLAARGHEVALVARGEHLAAIRRDGLRLVDHVGSASGSYRLPASDDPAAFGVQDLVVIAVKAHAIAAVLPRLRTLLNDDTVVVPAINGLPWWYFHGEPGPHQGRRLRTLDPAGTMFADLDCRHLLGCVVHVAAEVRAAGEVHHTGGRRLVLGEPDNSASGRLQRVCALLDDAGLEAQPSPRIRLDVWIKLLGNTSFNPVAALTGYLMNQICADEEVLDVIRAMMREGMAVSSHYGYPMPMTPDQRIDMARQLGAAKISMLQDLERRRPLELAPIVGAVIELAELAAIEVPTIRMVNALARGRARALGLA